MSIEQGSSNYFWDRGETQFTLEGIGKMYFDPFTHNDSIRFSSNFDLYHTGSLYLDKITFGNDTFNITSTIEEWMTQLNFDFNQITCSRTSKYRHKCFQISKRVIFRRKVKKNHS